MKGTLIETPGGAMPVERLGAGDRVICADGSVLPILWAGGRVLDEAELQARPQLRPVVFRFGSLGNRRELRLSPQHAVALHTVEGTRLARAIHLARRGDGAFRVAQGVKSVSYHHLLLPRHALLLAEGAVVESMWPGPIPMAAVGVENRADILRCAPRLKPALDGDAAVESLYGPRAAPVLSGREVKAMARIEAPQRRRLQQAA
ncbi:Hint domain-containing protein [Thalassovita aquimarina]|uniref:Hint domain-containing protein n=1 Tax=Thalassovita aquimarina TaxID=2785917 RepID=A0ABS5HMC3_9RHOB|nr:Hint domain-containing protein [Thalassovita aquimarina]